MSKVGTTWVDFHGYVRERTEAGWEFQHRLVMARTLGRVLQSDESVHHKNGDRADNRPDNLELWVGAQLPGQRVEDLVQWAREILKRYGGEA